MTAPKQSAGDPQVYTAVGGAGWERFAFHTLTAWPNHALRYLNAPDPNVSGTIDAAPFSFDTRAYAAVQINLAITAGVITPTPSCAVYGVELDSAGNIVGGRTNMGELISAVINVTATPHTHQLRFGFGLSSGIASSIADGAMKNTSQGVPPYLAVAFRMTGAIASPAGLIELWGYRG